MIMNLNLKIKGGPRTPVDIEIYGTAVNKKFLKFKNGREVSEMMIVDWTYDNLGSALKKVQNDGV